MQGELRTTTVIYLNDDMFPDQVSDPTDRKAMCKGFLNHMTKMLPKETRRGLLLRIYPAMSWLVKQSLVIAAITVSTHTVAALSVAYLINLAIHCQTDKTFNGLALQGKACAHLRSVML